MPKEALKVNCPVPKVAHALHLLFLVLRAAFHMLWHHVVFALLVCGLPRPLRAQECNENLPRTGGVYRLHARTRIATGCTPKLEDAHVLQVMENFCVRNREMFTPCPRATQRDSRVLEWSGINRLTTLGPEAFARMRDSRGPVLWYNGTSFGSYLGQFPHSIQGIMPILNLPAMGIPPTRFVQLPAADNFPQGHGLEHPYAIALLTSLSTCLGMDPSNIVGQRDWWNHHIGYNPIAVRVFQAPGFVLFLKKGEAVEGTFPVDKLPRPSMCHFCPVGRNNWPRRPRGTATTNELDSSMTVH